MTSSGADSRGPGEAVEYLLSPEAVRERCQDIFEAELEHFVLRLDRLDDVVRLVDGVTRERYEDAAIPIHGRFRHFGADGLRRLEEVLGKLDRLERARAEADLVVVNVLLDAGAGKDWRYREARTGRELARSEGLAAASLEMFLEGTFCETRAPMVTADGLKALDEGRLGRGFQAGPKNPLVGLRGRLSVLRKLGAALESLPELFGRPARPGRLVDTVPCDAREILRALLKGLGSIWPPRLTLEGIPLGDVWRHPKAGGSGESAGLVPFHKLSQWLTYSLVEPFEKAGGRAIENLDALTGLAEYRNGGLFVDMEVLVPKHDGVTALPHAQDSEIVVEWRALTVALLDRVAEKMGLPLANVLEGGTWRAGRLVASEKRPGGTPPIRVLTDGTLF